MKKLALIFFLVLLYETTFANASCAQISDADMILSKDATILDLGHKLSKQIGIIHQMQLNCNLRSEQTPEATSFLLENFLPRKNIKSLMVDYYKSIEDLKNQGCKRGELDKQFARTGTALKEFYKIGKDATFKNPSKITPHTPEERSSVSEMETPFFRGEVSILNGDLNTTIFRVLKNGATIKVLNDVHVRLVGNHASLPNSFIIVAPMTAVKLVQGNVPKALIQNLSFEQYFALRKKYYGN